MKKAIYTLAILAAGLFLWQVAAGENPAPTAVSKSLVAEQMRLHQLAFTENQGQSEDSITLLRDAKGWLRLYTKGAVDHHPEKRPPKSADSTTPPRVGRQLGATRDAWFLDFEWGLGHDYEQVATDVPGLQFTTTGGYDWVYSDITTGLYNATSDLGLVYGSGEYFMSGYVCTWLGPDADVGRIDFLNQDGSYFMTGYCSYSSFYVEAYDEFDNLIDIASGPANTLSQGGTGLNYLTVSSDSNNIAYMLLHDTGNQWIADNMSGDASGIVLAPVIDTLIDAGTGTDIVVKWHQPYTSGVTDFQVYRGQLAGQYDFQSDLIPADGSSQYQYAISDLEKHRLYYIAVRAYNSDADVWSAYTERGPIQPTIPVVLVHGIYSSYLAWSTFKPRLEEEGFNHVWAANTLHPCGVGGEVHFSGNAESLSVYIERKSLELESLTQITVPSIDIVAHSMGGLVSRRYICGIGDPWAHRSVNNLIMLGTPNGGVEFVRWPCLVLGILTGNNTAPWPCKGPAPCEMSTSSMREFNATYWNAGGALYHTAAGTAGRLEGELCPLVSLPNPFCPWPTTFLESCPNDGIVSCVSVESLYPVYPVYKRRDFWCHVGGYQGSEELVSEFVVPILRGVAPVETGQFAADEARRDEYTPPQISFSVCDSIMVSEWRTDTVNVEGGSLALLLLATDSLLAFTLESPSGIIWDSASAAMDTNVSYYCGAQGYGFHFEDAESGLWLVDYDAESISSPSAGFCLIVALSNGVILSTSLSEDYPLPGDSLILTATLTDNASPITGATVAAVPVWEQTDTLPPVNLLDDGDHGDGAPGDGVYGAIFNETTDSGLVVFDFVATGSGTSVGTFRREASSVAYFCEPQYVCGDVDVSGSINIGDVVYLINYIFANGPEPQPFLLNGDVDCSGDVNIGDVVYLINYIFGGGPTPCDPTGDGIPDC